MLSPKITFVCTGNICRSPMAEYLLKTLSPASWNLEVSSCGVMTCDGQPASTNGIVAALEEGVDMNPHKSRAARSAELRECDIILTMGIQHKQHLLVAMPDLKDRVYCLTEYGSSKGRCKDIPDPIGGDLNVYRKCLHRIKIEILRILPVLSGQFNLSLPDTNMG